MYTRILDNQQYVAISNAAGGIELKVPRYTKTETYIGRQKEARERGFLVKSGGTKTLYFLEDGTPVLNGYIAKPAKKFATELRIPKTVTLTETGLTELINEINLLSQVFFEALALQ